MVSFSSEAFATERENVNSATSIGPYYMFRYYWIKFENKAEFHRLCTKEIPDSNFKFRTAVMDIFLRLKYGEDIPPFKFSVDSISSSGCFFIISAREYVRSM
jgi:hypothetical protein